MPQVVKKGFTEEVNKELVLEEVEEERRAFQEEREAFRKNSIRAPEKF